MTRGARVLLTRPASEQARSAHLLEMYGYEVVRAPLIRRTWNVDEVCRCAEEHPSPDTVIVSSALVADILAACVPTGWGNARYAAVGPSTAARLREHGFDVSVEASQSTMAHLFTTMGDLSDSEVIYPHSELTPRERIEALRATGAAVRTVVAYRNEEPSDAHERVMSALPVDATLLFSSSAARRLARILQESSVDALGHVLALGPSTAETAKQVGLPVDSVARQHNINGLIEDLQRFLPL